MERLYTHSYDSPLGTLYVAVNRAGRAVRVQFDDFRSFLPVGSAQENKYACGELEYELERYFEGRLRTFEVPLEPVGTAFQLAVWERLRKIPYGTTVTYGELAQKMGRRGAARAVGNAVAANPIVLLIPCHRVLRADGTLGNYALHSVPAEVGREAKRRLLAIEGVDLPERAVTRTAHPLRAC